MADILPETGSLPLRFFELPQTHPLNRIRYFGCNPSAEIEIRPDYISLMSPEELAAIASYDFGTKKAQARE